LQQEVAICGFSRCGFSLRFLAFLRGIRSAHEAELRSDLSDFGHLMVTNGAKPADMPIEQPTKLDVFASRRHGRKGP
jgi:hypothetical protein